MSFLEGLEPGWLWMIGGVLLLICEIIAPGFFLVFVGGAAIAAGLFTLLFDLGVAGQLTLFAIYAAVAIMGESSNSFTSLCKGSRPSASVRNNLTPARNVRVIVS